MNDDLSDRRILGAVRFIDATTLARIASGLRVEAAAATLRANRAGLWVIWRATGLESQTVAFEQPPALPALESISIAFTVEDYTGRYLARTATVKLPRDASPANASQPNSLFQPISVTLYPAAAAPLWHGWSSIRASVVDARSGAPLGGVTIRVLHPTNNQVIARGMADARGEALVIVPNLSGAPAAPGAAAAATVPAAPAEFDVTVQAIVSPEAASPPDPDAIEADPHALTQVLTRKLAVGREVTAAFAIPAATN